jgi:NADH-quinone oxidoreductase subunit D
MVEQSNHKNTILNFGPQHPSSHGVLRLVLELDGEIIKRADPHIGQLHRGTEKLMEHKTYLQNIPFMDRLDYVSPINYEHTFCLAVEKLLDVDIPIRAKYIRVLLNELSRVSKHLFSIGAIAMDSGAMTPMVWLFEEREKIMEFFEATSGARLHLNYIRPGGVVKDIPDGLLDKIATWLINFPKVLQDTEALITENRIFKQRLVDIGIITKDQALDFGFSGPNLRASGIPWDLRKSQPYEIYEELDFDIVVGTTGDNYDRYLVRVKEIYESLKIIKQCIDKMPQGIVLSENNKITQPKRLSMKESMEEMIHHFKLFSQGFSTKKGNVYVATEVPSGEFGVYLVSDGSPKPYKVKLRSTGIAHLQALEHIMIGYQLADLPTTLGSLDVVFGEVDR